MTHQDGSISQKPHYAASSRRTVRAIVKGHRTAPPHGLTPDSLEEFDLDPARPSREPA